MKIIPARGYVLIEPEETDEVSAGGVVLPERMKDAPQKGKVLVCGDPLMVAQGYKVRNPAIDKDHGFMFEESPCKVGDTVIFKRFVDNKIKEDGKELLLVKFDDILGVYE